MSVSAGSLREAVNSLSWYHTLDLGEGVTTPGWFDCRRVAQQVLPERLDGKRCLDIGAFNGFWSFEMERRGAAEVIALDILDESRWDWPASSSDASREGIARMKAKGDGFLIAREALGSSVERIDASVYELDPAVHGSFDFVYLGSLLLHLRDPVRALECVRSVCTGTLASADAISLPLDLLVRTPVANLDGLGRPYWWKPNRRGFARMVELAGFRLLSGPDRFFMPPGRGMPKPRPTLRVLRMREGRELAFISRAGDPHARLTAEPEDR